jgi:hypothetical protein
MCACTFYAHVRFQRFGPDLSFEHPTGDSALPTHLGLLHERKRLAIMVRVSARVEWTFVNSVAKKQYRKAQPASRDGQQKN